MGTTYKGNAAYYRSVGQNILPTASKYPYRNGRFGENSPSTGNKTRNIASADPLGTAKDFQVLTSMTVVEPGMSFSEKLPSVPKPAIHCKSPRMSDFLKRAPVPNPAIHCKTPWMSNFLKGLLYLNRQYKKSAAPRIP